MTDKEAYELMVKYSDSNTLGRIKVMIHSIGIDATVELMAETYSEKGKIVTGDFRHWMKQSFEYLIKMSPLN